MRALVLIACVAGSVAQADVVVAARTLRAGTEISAGDIALSPDHPPLGAASHPDEVLGQEARVTLYAGRPIPLASLGPPALVDRNQLVTLVFLRGGLEIRAEGRALGRGAEGDGIRVMNLASRTTVSATVIGPALVSVP
ncbi:MAG: flagellar basal body P-ring formation chaperone FlgA [Pararhodobacter sp.]